MEQTLCYTETTMPMSRCYSTPPLWGQNHDNLIKESSYEQKGSRFSSQKRNTSPDSIRIEYVPTLENENNDHEDDIEDDESEFTMGRLIRQASFDSEHMSPPKQTTKVMKGSSSLPRYLSQKPEATQEKIKNLRKLESMKEISRSKNSMRIGKNNSGAPLILRGWAAKGSSEDMKAQIKFWARAVAFNVHQEC